MKIEDTQSWKKVSKKVLQGMSITIASIPNVSDEQREMLVEQIAENVEVPLLAFMNKIDGLAEELTEDDFEFAYRMVYGFFLEQQRIFDEYNSMLNLEPDDVEEQ